MMIAQPLVKPTELQRLDWRFLLPMPSSGAFDHLVLLGGTEGLSERLVDIGVARRVSYRLPKQRCADAVAVLYDTRPPLRDVVACLQPGAVVYYEVARPASSWGVTPQATTRAFHALGLTPTGLYAIRPHFDACQVYLPLTVPGALRWYVTTLYSAASPAQRLLEGGLQALTGLNGQRFASLAPYFAVTACAGSAESAMTSVLEHPDLPVDLLDRHLAPMVLADTGNRVALLPFASNGGQPVAVLKVPKLASFNGRTDNEQATLHAIRPRLAGPIRESIPRPLGCLWWGDSRVSVESYLPGQSLLPRSGRWGASAANKREDLRLAAEWLAEFHTQALIERRAWDAAMIAEWVEQPLDLYRARFGLTDGEARLFTATRQRAVTLMGAPLPLVWQHRDFNVWNVFRTRDSINVIDWEGGRPGPALCDLLHFVTHWHDTACHLHSEAEQLGGFRALFCKQARANDMAQAVQAALDHYLRRLAMDARFLPLLLVYTWVELALRRYEQQRDMGSLGSDARAGNRNFAFMATLADCTAQLLSSDEVW